MNFANNISLVNWTSGIVMTIISIIVAFAIIAILLNYIRKSKSRGKGMVHNKKKPNDKPN